MRKDLYSHIQNSLELSGFLPLFSDPYRKGPDWFVKKHPCSGVDACLRVEFGSRFRTLSFSLGWRQKMIRDFCMEVLEDSWPEGHKWLFESGFLLSPCMNYFSLGEVMGWELSAVPVDDESRLMSEISRLCEIIAIHGWDDIDFDKLINLYASNQKPFCWLMTNSALRLAEIAAICAIRNIDDKVFETCAAEHKALIQSDMFNTGEALEWVSALRKKIGSAQCSRA